MRLLYRRIGKKYYNTMHTKLYHFTSFEAATKIIASGRLLFKSGTHKNDIAEIYKLIYSNLECITTQNALNEYQYLSFTADNESAQGYEIDALWGHYAERGSGICIVFDKEKILQQFHTQYPTNKWEGIIAYSKYSPISQFIECAEDDDVHTIIEDNIEEIFFTKALDWKYESEFRLLIKADTKADPGLEYNDSLIGIILFHQGDQPINETIQFQTFSKLLGENKTYYYRYELGDKTLYDAKGNVKYPQLGQHYELDC